MDDGRRRARASALIVHHDDAAREWAYDRESGVGRLARGLDEGPRRGWVIVSMKDDWAQGVPRRPTLTAPRTAGRDAADAMARWRAYTFRHATAINKNANNGENANEDLLSQRPLSACSLATFAPGTAVAADEHTGDMGTLTAEKVGKSFPARPYSPYAGRNFPTRPLFGDTHLHTSYLHGRRRLRRPGRARSMPTASPGARRSPPPAASR